MKNMFHYILNATITGLMIVMIGISFLMLTDNHTSSPSIEIKVDYSTEGIHNPRTNNIKGNPEKWIILNINEDYSIAKVLKEDGNIYYMTIFNATDNFITFNVNGELHEFFFIR